MGAGRDVFRWSAHAEDHDAAVETALALRRTGWVGGFRFTIAHGHETLRAHSVADEFARDPLGPFLGEEEILAVVAFGGGMAFDDEGFIEKRGRIQGFGDVDDQIVGVGVGEVGGALTEEDVIPADGGLWIDAIGDGVGIVGGVGGRRLVVVLPFLEALRPGGVHTLGQGRDLDAVQALGGDYHRGDFTHGGIADDAAVPVVKLGVSLWWVAFVELRIAAVGVAGRRGLRGAAFESVHHAADVALAVLLGSTDFFDRGTVAVPGAVSGSGTRLV